jgi:hypothetical protein
MVRPETRKVLLVDGLNVLGPDGIVFVLDVSDDFLQNVLQGHQARRSPVFVEDDGHVLLVGLEIEQDVFDVLGFRDEVGWPQHGSQFRRGLLVADKKAQELLAVQHADDLILGFLVDGQARMPAFKEFSGDFGDGFVDLGADDVGARDHDFVCLFVIKLQHVQKHGHFVVLQFSAVFGLLDGFFQMAFAPCGKKSASVWSRVDCQGPHP